jgi:spore coat protein CotH
MNTKHLFLAFLLAFFLTACSSKKENTTEITDQSYSCGAEKKDGKYFVGKNLKFEGTATRTDSISFTGNYSVRAVKNNKYALSATFENIKKGNVIVARIWKKSKSDIGKLVISDKKGEQFLASARVKQEKDGWVQLENFFIAARDYESVSVYGINSFDTPVFFDDIEIHTRTKNTLPPKSLTALQITIPKAEYKKLEKYRKKALQDGVISSKLKKYVDGQIKIGNKLVEAKIRLKGDWTDHLKTNKWSLRVKIEGEGAFMGMEKFSIQSPGTRSFMLEWFAHELMMEEGLLATRYRFIPVEINGKRMGVYAIEEHFEKHLLESQKRREGPIVKFDEEGMWELNYLGTKLGQWLSAPTYESSEILPYKKNKTWKDSTLHQNFLLAQSRMNSMKQGELPVSDFLDADKYAKYIALSDVLAVCHNTIWHNLRLYYNPITTKLEPITFDCFHDFANEKPKRNFVFTNKGELVFVNENIQSLFKDTSFTKTYLKYLKAYSDTNFINEFIGKKSEEIKRIEKLLKYEYFGYSFDKEYIKMNLLKTKSLIPSFEKNYFNDHVIWKESKEVMTLPKDVVLESVSLKAFTENSTENKTTLLLRNYHTHPIKIIAYSHPDDKKKQIALTPVEIPAYANTVGPQEKIISIPSKVKKLFFTSPNCSGCVFDLSVAKWPSPKERSHLGNYTSEGLSKDANGNWTLSGGTYEQNLFIPELEGEVIIPAGTKFDLIKGAAIISYSPLKFMGVEGKPIKVTSSDSSSSGVIILGKGKTEIIHTHFSNLGSMDKNLWSLTGAVTVHEGEVKISHSSFMNNHCEDALNLVRCSFEMDNTEVGYTLSDGFDADFCTGEVRASKVHHTGNDGLDFSTSEIKVYDCKLSNIGDKGISGGENSTLNIEKTHVTNANIAFASKDLSFVYINNCSIDSTLVGFACYRKKPEYGGGTMKIEKTDTTGISKSVFLVEKESKIKYNSSHFEGKSYLNIDSLYAPFRR